MPYDVADQVEDLGLNRHIERRGGLIGDQDSRPAGNRHCDHDALAHSAGKLVRIGLRPLLRIGYADRTQQLDSGASASALVADWCSMMASAIWSPTVKTGLSDVIGS